MVKFVVGLFEMSPERKSITREMLAQAFGDNWQGFIILDILIFESKEYTKQFLLLAPPVDLAILDGDLDGLDKYHPYEFSGGFTSCGAWGFWGTSGEFSKEEIMKRASKLIKDINFLSKHNPLTENKFPTTKDINFIF